MYNKDNKDNKIIIWLLRLSMIIIIVGLCGAVCSLLIGASWHAVISRWLCVFAIGFSLLCYVQIELNDFF